MYPPTHIAFAYLTAREIVRKPLSGPQLWILAGLSVLPDLSDKAIHYVFGIFNSGRNITHNIFFLLLLIILYLILRHSKFKTAVLLGLIAIGTHQLGDLIQPMIKSLYTSFSDASDWYLYTLFPLYDPFLLPWAIDPIGIAWESLLIAAALFFWVRDGMPGLPSNRGYK
jgi:membrane-bound metal-dependent hydrolase YbcI (DUF457 family)